MTGAAIRATGHYLPPDVYRRGSVEPASVESLAKRLHYLVHDGPAALKVAVISWLFRVKLAGASSRRVAKRPGGQFTYGDRLVLSALGSGFTPGSFCFPWAIA